MRASSKTTDDETAQIDCQQVMVIAARPIASPRGKASGLKVVGFVD